MNHTTHSRRTSTGLARHATGVAMTTARSLTSHVRQRYQDRYKGRYRLSGLVFGFDTFLLGVVAILFVFDAVFLFQAFLPSDPGIDLSFLTPSLRASDAVPLEVRLHTTDGKRHDDVGLRWKLPEWVEVLHADPPLSGDGVAYLGAVLPGQEYSSRVVVRIRASAGTNVPFSFEIQQMGFLGFPRVDSGVEKRIVQQGALRVEPAVESRHIISGGTVPLILTNDGSATATLLTLRLTAQDGASNARLAGGDVSLFVKDLGAGEHRPVFIDIGQTSATSIHFAWELQDGAQIVTQSAADFTVRPAERVSVKEPLTWVTGRADVRVSYQNFSQAGRVFVAHPLLASADGSNFRLYPLPLGEGSLSVPLTRSADSSGTEWSVIPIDDAVPGGILGKRSVGRLSATIPFSAEARYYTATGDQIGIGPLPPRVGEQTTYWIAWSIGPLDTDVKQLSLKTTLPANIRATGKFASAAQGTFQTDGRQVTWIVPTLPATGGERATFAFEVSLTPTREMAGSSVSLIGESIAEAIDAKTGDVLTADASGDTTDLPHDQKATGKGTVK